VLFGILPVILLKQKKTRLYFFAFIDVSFGNTPNFFQNRAQGEKFNPEREHQKLY